MINARSKKLRLSQYDTDKVANGYLDRYDQVLSPLVDKKIKLLELGVHKGGSIRFWRDYFSLGIITGIDIRLPNDLVTGERIHLFKGRQDNPEFLSEVANKIAPEGFDIIIDDASHIGELTKKSFWHLFDNHLKPGGLYIIEDWGTGYWDDWPDGKTFHHSQSIISGMWARLLGRINVAKILPLKFSFPCHSYGMVGFVKELVDEQGAADATRVRSRGEPARRSKFDNMLIAPSIVFVKKAS